MDTRKITEDAIIRQSLSMSRRAVMRRAKRDEELAAEPPKVLTQIKCLKCRQPFMSENRRSNRICEPCRIDNEEGTGDYCEASYDANFDGAVQLPRVACSGGSWVQRSRGFG